MKISTIKNIQFINDIFVCPAMHGIVISEFEIQLDGQLNHLESDHCECIDSFVKITGTVINIRLVTDKNEIDEYLIFRFLKNNKPFNLKIKFQR